MTTSNRNSLWICLGISAGIGIIIGIIGLIMTSSSSFGKSGKALSHDSDDIEIVEDDMDILSSDDDDNGDSESSGGDAIASEDEFDF